MTAADTSTSLATFVLAHIEADDAAARAAMEEAGDDGRWRVQDFGYEGVRIGSASEDDRPPDPTLTTAETAHIARHDPARVLATCAAHRKIVEQFEWERTHLSTAPEDPEEQRSLEALEFAVRALAAAYADRPGYDERWAL